MPHIIHINIVLLSYVLLSLSHHILLLVFCMLILAVALQLLHYSNLIFIWHICINYTYSLSFLEQMPLNTVFETIFVDPRSFVFVRREYPRYPAKKSILTANPHQKISSFFVFFFSLDKLVSFLQLFEL